LLETLDFVFFRFGFPSRSKSSVFLHSSSGRARVVSRLFFFFSVFENNPPLAGWFFSIAFFSCRVFPVLGSGVSVSSFFAFFAFLMFFVHVCLLRLGIFAPFPTLLRPLAWRRLLLVCGQLSSFSFFLGHLLFLPLVFVDISSPTPHKPKRGQNLFPRPPVTRVRRPLFDPPSLFSPQSIEAGTMKPPSAPRSHREKSKPPRTPLFHLFFSPGLSDLSRLTCATPGRTPSLHYRVSALKPASLLTMTSKELLSFHRPFFPSGPTRHARQSPPPLPFFTENKHLRIARPCLPPTKFRPISLFSILKTLPFFLDLVFFSFSPATIFPKFVFSF